MCVCRLYDVQNLGYIEEDDFKQCLRGFLTCDDGYLEELVATLCPSSSIKPLRKVPYPKFLAMLEEVHASSHHRPVSYPSCAEVYIIYTKLNLRKINKIVVQANNCSGV